MKRTSSSTNEMHVAAANLFTFMRMLINKTDKKTIFIDTLNDYDDFRRYAQRMHMKLWRYDKQD